MSRGTITWIRAGVVLVYAAIGAALAPGGLTAGEFGLMIVLGGVCFVAIVVADWVNDGVRHDDGGDR